VTAVGIVAPDQALIDVAKRCRALAMGLAWKIPFFLPVMAQVEFLGVREIPTACVDLRGIVRVNPDFAATLKDNELAFVVAHEFMHLLLLHHDRRADRDPLRWNLATDRVINRTLATVADQLAGPNGTDDRSPLRLPSSALLAAYNQATWTAEQLYQAEAEPSDELRQQHEQGTLSVGQGCGPAPAPEHSSETGDGDGDGAGAGDDAGDGDGDSQGAAGATAPPPGSSDSARRRRWQETAVACQLRGREAGNGPGNLLAGAIDLPVAKVRWAQLLRGTLHRAVAEAGRDDVAWSRRSRRSTPEMPLPGGITYRCRAAVVIDTSASMTDAMLAAIVTETAQIVDQCRVPVFLVVHDYVVQSAGWIRPGSRYAVTAAVRARLAGRGGTLFEPAYDRVAAEPGRFNVMVHLTDGEVQTWPAAPPNVRRFIAALLGPGGHRQAPPAQTRTIEIEL
jgi:predicted metal-dependent peptidase